MFCCCLYSFLPQDNQSYPAYLVTYVTVNFGEVEALRAARTLGAGLAALAAPAAAPSGGAALTWPNNARVCPKGVGAAGDDDGPWLIKFPPRDAAGGIFARLRVRPHSTGDDSPPEHAIVVFLVSPAALPRVVLSNARGWVVA